MEIQINAWSKRKGHQRLRKAWHFVMTFVLGVAIATAYHLIVTNQQVRKTAEAVCDNFGRDAKECKDGIDNVLDMSDNVLDNNVNVE